MAGERFTINPEATQEVQRKLFAFGNTPANSSLGRVIQQHFILNDKEYPKRPLHLIGDLEKSDEGLALVDKGSERLQAETRFAFIRATFLEIAQDREQTIRFYYNTQLYEIDPNGQTSLVRR